MSEDPLTIESLESDGELFRPLRQSLGIESFGINLITLRPRQRMRVHRHQRQEEVYAVLEGELTLLVEGEPRTVAKGQIARLGPEAKRQLTNQGTEPLVILALGGSGKDHESRDAQAWADWDEGGEGRSPRDVPLPPDLPG